MFHATEADCVDVAQSEPQVLEISRPMHEAESEAAETPCHPSDCHDSDSSISDVPYRIDASHRAAQAPHAEDDDGTASEPDTDTDHVSRPLAPSPPQRDKRPCAVLEMRERLTLLNDGQGPESHACWGGLGSTYFRKVRGKMTNFVCADSVGRTCLGTSTALLALLTLLLIGNVYLSSWPPFRRPTPFVSDDYSQSYGKSATHSRALRDAASPRSAPTAGSPSRAILVVAGKMTVEDGPCNIAQYSLNTQQWSLDERIQLSLYNSYQGGEVYSLMTNHSSPALDADTTPLYGYDDDDDDIWHRAGLVQEDQIGGELIVVGAFDTTYRNSQVTYCSVGKWNGEVLSKVGEGLCNSALSKGMKITCAAMAGPTDVYVAGSFHTQVWNGHEFVKIFNVAHYNASNQVWLPLPVGQITCSWCTVTVLSLAWDPVRHQLHVAGKFNAIDGRNIPAGLAIYDTKSGRLVAHPGGGLTMRNSTEDGVGTALQLDERRSLLYVMGSFERLSATGEICMGLAAYDIASNRWTCLADDAHTVLPTGGGNMLITPYGLMVAGMTTSSTTWPDSSRPYTIAVLKTVLRKKHKKSKGSSDATTGGDDATDEALVAHEFKWSWLPGFGGNVDPLHSLANGFGDYEGKVFIGGDNLVAMWGYEETADATTGGAEKKFPVSLLGRPSLGSARGSTKRPVTVDLNNGHVHGAIMAIAQFVQHDQEKPPPPIPEADDSLIIYWVALGTLLGIIIALLFNRNLNSTISTAVFNQDANKKGISLDTLTYSAGQKMSVADAYISAMRTRFVQHPHLLTIIDPQEIILHRIIGEGTFGRVWSARWRSSSVAVKEFVFAQAAVAGRSQMQREIVEEIIGEAGMMAILRHPNVLQLFGCSLTVQAIWIVSELCSLGSLRQLLDDENRDLSMLLRVRLALQVAEGMTYLHTQDPPIIHRDLKSHNIFVHETFETTEEGEEFAGELQYLIPRAPTIGMDDSDPDRRRTRSSKSTILAKIGDWGSARATLATGSRTMTHGVGTACWLAPEVIKHARSSKLSDVYGFGIILWELATREEVYQGLESTQIIAQVANDKLRPEVPEGCPFADVMVRCWSEEPLDRMSFEEVVVALSEVKRRLEEEEEAEEAGESLAETYPTSYQNV